MDRIRKALMTLNGLAGLLKGVVPEPLEGRPTFLKDTIDWIDSGDEDAYQEGFVTGIRKMDPGQRDQFANVTGIPRALIAEAAGEEPGDKTRKLSEIRDDVIEAIAAKYDRGEEVTRRGQ